MAAQINTEFWVQIVDWGANKRNTTKVKNRAHKLLSPGIYAKLRNSEETDTNTSDWTRTNIKFGFQNINKRKIGDVFLLIF